LSPPSKVIDDVEFSWPPLPIAVAGVPPEPRLRGVITRNSNKFIFREHQQRQKGRLSGELKLLVITPTTACSNEIYFSGTPTRAKDSLKQ
jgi:hypothetical protein